MLASALAGSLPLCYNIDVWLVRRSPLYLSCISLCISHMSLYNYISSAITICCLSIFSIVQSFSFSIRMKSSHLLYVSFFISLYIICDWYYINHLSARPWFSLFHSFSYVRDVFLLYVHSNMIYKKKRHSRLLLARHVFSFLKETIANPGKGVNNFSYFS